MKEAMNHCLDEMLLLITEQSHALSEVQGKCLAYQMYLAYQDTIKEYFKGRYLTALQRIQAS